jgi:transcription elongation factor S-II
MCQLFHIDRVRELHARSSVDKWTCEERLALYRTLKHLISDANSWKEYRSKMRRLLFNLRHSPEIERRRVSGDLTSEWLLTATPQEMWPERWEHVELPIYLQREVTTRTGVEEQGTTTAFRCGKCGKRKCTYALAQTRCADEGMTQFIQCVACGNRWKMG